MPCTAPVLRHLYYQGTAPLNTACPRLTRLLEIRLSQNPTSEKNRKDILHTGTVQLLSILCIMKVTVYPFLPMFYILHELYRI